MKEFIKMELEYTTFLNAVAAELLKRQKKQLQIETFSPKNALDVLKKNLTKNTKHRDIMEEQSTKESAKNHGFLNLHLDLYANLEKELIYKQKQNNLYIKPMFDLINLLKKYNFRIVETIELEISEHVDMENKCLVRTFEKNIIWCNSGWFKEAKDINDKSLEKINYLDPNHWDLFITNISRQSLWRNPYETYQHDNKVESSKIQGYSIDRFLDLDSEDQQEVSYEFAKIYSGFSRSMSYERRYEDGGRLNELINRTKDFYSDPEIEYELPDDDKTLKNSLKKFIKE